MSELVLTRAEVRALDRRATAEFGVPALLLMENAGRAAADEAERLLGGRRGPVAVIAGPGNNGGDGLVRSRDASHIGFEAADVGASRPDGADHRPDRTELPLPVRASNRGTGSTLLIIRRMTHAYL